MDYSYQLLPTIVALRKVLPIVKEKKLVPFTTWMNWEIDEDFKYPRLNSKAERNVAGKKKKVAKKAKKVKSSKKKIHGKKKKNNEF